MHSADEQCILPWRWQCYKDKGKKILKKFLRTGLAHRFRWYIPLGPFFGLAPPMHAWSILAWHCCYPSGITMTDYFPCPTGHCQQTHLRLHSLYRIVKLSSIFCVIPPHLRNRNCLIISCFFVPFPVDGLMPIKCL